MDRIRRIKHIALDMDGTIYNGNTLFPFTIAFLDKMKELGIGYSFLTNNPSKSTNDYLRHLSGMGIKAVKDEFYTSAQATTTKGLFVFLQRKHKSRIYPNFSA